MPDEREVSLYLFEAVLKENVDDFAPLIERDANPDFPFGLSFGPFNEGFSTARLEALTQHFNEPDYLDIINLPITKEQAQDTLNLLESYLYLFDKPKNFILSYLWLLRHGANGDPDFEENMVNRFVQTFD